MMEIDSKLNLSASASISLHTKSDTELLRAYWVFKLVSYPAVVSLGAAMGAWAVNNVGLARRLLRKTIFAHFCGGETIKDCRPTIAALDKADIGTILDYSVEGTDDEASYDATAEEILATIYEASRRRDIPFSVFKVSGLGNSAFMEAKQKGVGLAEAETKSLARTEKRIERICTAAKNAEVRIFFDAEETAIQGYIDEACLAMMRQCNGDQAIVFNTYQLYLKDGLARLKADAEAILADGLYFGCKLVRGAYMEKEAALAQKEGRDNPINPTKVATDTMYDAAAAYCLERIDRISICLGTHNMESCQQMIDAMAEKQIAGNHPHIWFAQLLGMSDNLSYPLAAAGYNVAKYVPYGPVPAVIPYLIRRAQENSSVKGQTGRELELVSQELKNRKLSPWRYFL